MRTSLSRQLSFVAFSSCLSIATPQLSNAAPDDTLGTAVMSASVNADASLARGSGVVSVAHPQTGTYVVTFERDLSACTATATFGQSDGEEITTTQNFISANFDSTAPTTVKIKSVINGSASDIFGWQLIVFCPK